MIKKLLYSSLFILMTTGVTYASDNQEEKEKVVRGECVDIKDERVIATINILEKYTANEALRNPFENINNIACFFKEFDINNYRPIGYPKIIIDIPKSKTINIAEDINKHNFDESVASLNLEAEYVKGLLDKSNKKLTMEIPELNDVSPRIKPSIKKEDVNKTEKEIVSAKIETKEDTLEIKDIEFRNDRIIHKNHKLLTSVDIKNNMKDDDLLQKAIKEKAKDIALRDFSKNEKGTWKVQVAALRNIKRAENAKIEADKQFSKIFKEESYLSPKDVNGETYNRIVFGSFTKKEAFNKCKEVKKEKGNCFITK